MSRRLSGIHATALVTLTLVACADPGIVRSPVEGAPARGGIENSILGEAGAVHRQYGAATKVGNGIVRTYILRDKSTDVPLEVGVAMSESVMEGLPAPMDMSGMPATHGQSHQHLDTHLYLLDMPAQNPTQYQFVELNWNPAGHEPAGVYDLPHFDFHFWIASAEERASIVPTDPQYAVKAASYPTNEYRAPFYLDAATAAQAPAAAVAVPLMGVHWLDVRSPELQRLTGHPEAYKPFTTTFLYGSWNGKFIFDEPMITRAFIMSKRSASDPAVRNEVIPVSTPQRYAPSGFYPRAYRIAWDESAREYRIALTQLVSQQQ
jgi:hypothetical protein